METLVRTSAFALLILLAPECGPRPRRRLPQPARRLSSPNIVSPATTRIRRKPASILSALAWKPNDVQTFDRWVEVFDKVDKQKMPPPSQETPRSRRPGGVSARRCGTELRRANLARQRTEGRVVLRRLNRVEYENTLHDLLAIDVPLQHYLPEDTTTNGFDNVAVGLRLSMLHMEQYLEAADAAISAAMDFRRRPEGIQKRLRYHDEESVQDDVKKKEKKTFRVLPDAVVIFDDNSPTVLRQWIVQDRGRYRIRISGRAVPGGRTAGLAEAVLHRLQDPAVARLLRHAGRHAARDGSDHHARGGPITQSQSVRHELRRSRPAKRLLGNRRRRGIAGRGIAIEWVEVEGPLVDHWPPPSVGRLFGDLPVKPVEPARQAEVRPGRRAFAIAPDDPRSAAAAVLREFASRAFRRPVTSADVERFRQAGAPGLDDGLTLRGRHGRGLPRRDHVAKVPVSRRTPRASRRLGTGVAAVVLSLEHAARRRAAKARRQRDLAPTGHPARPGRTDAGLAQIPAFVENFVGQWLDLRQIDFTLPDRKLYPEFDDILKAAMVGETHAFFAQMLRDDSKLNNFIHSDFLMLNRCIAEHYKIDGVTGEEFRRVPLPAGSHRGGVLTQASVLKVTANGTFTSPVLLRPGS